EQDRDLLRLGVAAREVRLPVAVEVGDRDRAPAVTAGHLERRAGSRREAARAVAEQDRERVPAVRARRQDEVGLAVSVQVGGGELGPTRRNGRAGSEVEAA